MPLRATAAKNTAGKILRDWPLLAALALCLLAAALRIPSLRDSLWLDELHTAWCALGPLDEVAPRAAMGNQGPLFYWLEWLLTVIFGESEFSLRFPSLIAGALLPFCVFLLARLWRSDIAGLVAAALIAIDHLSIFYSTEARPYAMVQLLAAIFMLITTQLADRPSSRLRIAWVLTAAALFHLHYTTALVIVAAAAYLVSVYFIQRKQRAFPLATSTVDFTIVALLCSLAASNVVHIMARRANWAAFVQQLPLRNSLEWTPLSENAWLPLLIAAAFGWWWTARTIRRSSPPQFLVLVLAWLLLPLFTAWALTSTNVARLFFPRYIAAALPAATLLAGLCVDAIPLRWPKSLAALLTIAAALSSSGIIDQVRHDGRIIADRNEDWRSCVQWLNERVAADGRPVLVYSGLIEADELTRPHDPLLDAYCLCPVNSLYSLDVAPSEIFPLPLHNPGQISPTAEQLILHRHGCWLIVRGSKELAVGIATQVQQILKQSLITPSGANGEFEIKSFGSVQAVSIDGE